jgi:hypothetical protein
MAKLPSITAYDDSTKPVVIRVVLRRGNRRRLAADRTRLQNLLGKLVLEWGRLHEELAGIFQVVTKCEFWLAQPMWHTIKSDLAQRELLLAALRATVNRFEVLRPDLPDRYKIKVYEEMIWAITRINEFSHKRNDLIHAPIVFHMGADSDDFKARISDWTGDPRARKLSDQDLYQYCEWCVAFAKIIGSYIRSLYPPLHDPQKTLPKRPSLPQPSQFQTQKKEIRQKKRKSLQPRHRSSRA